MAKIPDLKKTVIQVQEAHRFPNKMNSSRPIPRHIIKRKHRLMLRAERINQSYTRESP